MQREHRQQVLFTYRPAAQDGFDFWALDGTIEASPRPSLMPSRWDRATRRLAQYEYRSSSP